MSSQIKVEKAGIDMEGRPFAWIVVRPSSEEALVGKTPDRKTMAAVLSATGALWAGDVAEAIERLTGVMPIRCWAEKLVANAKRIEEGNNDLVTAVSYTVGEGGAPRDYCYQQYYREKSLPEKLAFWWQDAKRVVQSLIK